MKMSKEALHFINKGSAKERAYISKVFKAFMSQPTDKNQSELLRAICVYKQKIEELEGKALKEEIKTELKI